MAAAALRRIDAAGNRIDFTALAECHLSGDQRAAAPCRLNDEHPLRESADDAVARREEHGQRLRPGGILGEDCPARRSDLRQQAAVLGRIDNIHAAAENRNSPSAAQCTAMRTRVDPARRTADNGDSRCREMLRKLECSSLPIA